MFRLFLTSVLIFGSLSAFASPRRWEACESLHERDLCLENPNCNWIEAEGRCTDVESLDARWDHLDPREQASTEAHLYSLDADALTGELFPTPQLPLTANSVGQVKVASFSDSESEKVQDDCREALGRLAAPAVND